MARKRVVWTLAAVFLPAAAAGAVPAKAPAKAPPVKAPSVRVIAAPPAPPLIVAPPAPPVPKQVDYGAIPEPVDPAPDRKIDKDRHKAALSDGPICLNAGELKDWMVNNKLEACNRLLKINYGPTLWTLRAQHLQHRALALLNLPGGQTAALAALDAADALASDKVEPLWDTSGGQTSLMLRAFALNGLGKQDQALKLLEKLRAGRPWSVSNVAVADDLESTFTNDLGVLGKRLEERRRLDPDVTRFLVYLHLMRGDLEKSAMAANQLSLVDPALHGNWSMRGEGDNKDQLASRLRYDCVKAYVAAALGKPDQAKGHFEAAKQAIIAYVGPDLTLRMNDKVDKPTRGQLKAYEKRKLDGIDLGQMVDEWVRLTGHRQTSIEAGLDSLMKPLGEFKHKSDLVPGVIELLDYYGKTHGDQEGKEAKLLSAALLRRVLGDAVTLEARELGQRIPRVEELWQIPKFASTASKWLFSDGSGYSQSKEGDGDVRTVRYESTVGSRSMVEEMGLLAIANYARQEGKDAFVILSDRTVARTTTVYGYYGIGNNTYDAGFESQYRVRLVDSKALPIDLIDQQFRVIPISEVEAGLQPRYQAYMARKETEAQAKKAAAKKGG